MQDVGVNKEVAKFVFFFLIEKNLSVSWKVAAILGVEDQEVGRSRNCWRLEIAERRW